MDMQQEINSIKVTCAETTKEFSGSLRELNKDIKYIREDQERQGKKLDAQDKKLDIMSNRIVDKIEALDSKFATREEFIFWRNILVAGILVSIFLGIISQWISK